MASNSGWNKNVPSGTSSIAQGDDDIRSFKSFMQAAWEDEHYFTDGSNDSAGVHKLGSARVYVGTKSLLSNPEPGRLFWATDEQRLYAATSASSWSQVPGTATDSVNTWTALQKYQVASQSSTVFSVLTTSGTTSRFFLTAAGILQWGDGHNAVDTNLYRQGANHLKSDDTLEAANLIVNGTASLSSATLSVNALRVGGGVNIKGIYQFTVVFPATSIGPESEQQVTTPNTSSLTSGDILICEQEPLPESRSWVRAWVVPSTGVIAVRRRNLSSDLTLSFSTATINVLGFDIT